MFVAVIIMVLPSGYTTNDYAEDMSHIEAEVEMQHALLLPLEHTERGDEEHNATLK